VQNRNLGQSGTKVMTANMGINVGSTRTMNTGSGGTTVTTTNKENTKNSANIMKETYQKRFTGANENL
jgi:hypothetical protein